MLDRIIITFVLVGGLGLLWFGWQYYKVKMMRTIRPLEAANGKPNLLYFTGEYCSACKFQQTPIVEAISTKLGKMITVKEYNISNYPELASRYKVFTLPTTIILNESGQVTHINYGVTRQDKLETQLLSS
jgi:thiol-disulfide isomerase/thioredoxin